MRKFDLWSLDLVENNIPVLHSLSPERWQNFTWNSIIPFRNIFVQKHKNNVIVASIILILRIWVVLKASVASMTSSASFHQKNYWAWFFHQPWHQSDLFWSDNVGWIIKNSLFSWFLTHFLLEAVEDRDVTFNQIKGSYIKFPQLRIPKPPSN